MVAYTAEQGPPDTIASYTKTAGAGGSFAVHINGVQSKSSRERAAPHRRKFVYASVSGHNHRFRRNQASMITAITAMVPITRK